MTSPTPQRSDDVPDLAASEAVVKGRKYGSDFIAAFNETMSQIYATREESYLFMVFMDMARRAEEQAEKARVAPSASRRFHANNWIAECFYRRETIPKSLPIDEKRKRKLALDRAWRRDRWPLLHRRQCLTHLGFVDRRPGGIVETFDDETGEKIGTRRDSSVYVERLTDFLAAVVTRYRKLQDKRRGLSTTRMRQAVAEELEMFRAIPENIYAPDYMPVVTVGVEPETDVKDSPAKTRGRQSTRESRKT